jgi:hypothetical protein
MKIFYSLILFIYNKFLNYKEYNISFLWIFLAKLQEIPVPNNASSLFYFSYGILLLSAVALISFINLFNTILVLQFKDRLGLEVKFKNYPFILKLINYYEKASFINILIESLIVFLIIIFLFISSLLMVLK